MAETNNVHKHNALETLTNIAEIFYLLSLCQYYKLQVLDVLIYCTLNSALKTLCLQKITYNNS